ncbi:MAG: hypothetical protein HDR86_01825 [Bacteroides sp.]|nr:hypothetical protein [Bacteroides sp.]MBD5351549.1 hypothetical protein [Bacteroides sp.]MBD5361522.1 hypothetical protein [Bacteroides sp.]
MSKLIIPAAELIGTPLTPEELKGILAGEMKYTCMCTWEDEHSYYEDFIKGPKTGDKCSASCHELCNTKATCSEPTLKYSFTEEYI